ncbi:MAG: hypothetical protein QG665_268 [Patescibacteria group bacterium]|nr:hypothetical protein [Patescibacteria group bacterium]
MVDNIFVKKRGGQYFVCFLGKEYPVTVGQNGLSTNRAEGDMSTPAGCFSLKEVYYRADRLSIPKTGLPTRAIEQNMGWCTMSTCADYNTRVLLPHDGDHENLWRDDHIYDLLVVLDYNNNPVVPGRGSAIFLHLARPDFLPTAGCVAFLYDDLVQILAEASLKTKICIEG